LKIKFPMGSKELSQTLIPKGQVLDKKSTGELKLMISPEYSFNELETYLPVYHKNQMLAILFLRRKDPDLELDLDFTEAITNILGSGIGE